MSLIPMDNTHVVQSVQNDAIYLRNVLDWVNTRYSIYNQNLTTNVMTAAGIPAADQPFVLAFIADLGRIQTLSTGTLPSTTDSFNYNINALLGLS